MECMTYACDYDQLSISPSEGTPLFDCYSDCIAGGCDITLLRNGVCDQECNISVCGLDFGDCGICSQGCLLEDLENDSCDSVCDT